MLRRRGALNFGGDSTKIEIGPMAKPTGPAREEVRGHG
jgi:hypothetical protein